MLHQDISKTMGARRSCVSTEWRPRTSPCTSNSRRPIPGVRSRIAWRSASSKTRNRAAHSRPDRPWSRPPRANTGIALALVCAARGYPFVAVMPESFSVERRQIMRAYGAKVVLTPAADRASGAVRVAAQLAQERTWFLARQFDNEANPAYHRQTTGPEILSDFAGMRLDYWVTGWEPAAH